MNFELSNEQRDIQKAVREFIEAELTKDYMIEQEKNSRFPWEVMKKAAELGFITIDIPEEYGGAGYGLLEKTIVLEEFCRVGGGIGCSLGGCPFASKIILRFGSEAQKRKYLPLACNGEGLPFIGAFTEPDKGTDLVTFPLGTTAKKSGNDYLINGTKTFITHGDNGKFCVILCQTDVDAKPAYRGQSTFIIEDPVNQKGYTVSLFDKMGWHSSSTTQISLSDVRVPQENMIGAENRGFYNVIGFLAEFRVETGAMGVGIAQGAFERALAYAKTREAFGRKIGTFQSISHKIAEMATKVETARLMVQKAASTFDARHEISPALSSMAKWYGAHVAVEVCDDAIEILGGHGYMLENDVERFYRDARMLELIEGTREAQKNSIANTLLGKLD
jgi:alkylation response protein AidB-like acyl-CoA dehydrogenase